MKSRDGPAIDVPLRILSMLVLLVASGCRLDVTQTIDVTAKAGEVITYTETFDDEAFRVATQLGGPTPFGLDTAKEDGWAVHESNGPNRHTFVFGRTFAGEDPAASITRLALDSAAANPILMGPTAFIGIPITASIRGEKGASIPALLRPAEAVAKNGRKDPKFQLANARVNAAAVDSVVHVRVEFRDSTGVHRIEPSSPRRSRFCRRQDSNCMSVVLGTSRRSSPFGATRARTACSISSTTRRRFATPKSSTINLGCSALASTRKEHAFPSSSWQTQERSPKAGSRSTP